MTRSAYLRKEITKVALTNWMLLFVWGSIALLLCWAYISNAFDGSLEALTNLEILWFTAYAIIRYTQEAYQTRVISERLLRQNIMPILEPQETDYALHGNHFKLKVVNRGQGSAFRIRALLNETSVVVPKNLAAGGVPLFLEVHTEYVQELTEQIKPEVITMDIVYSDAVEEEYAITNLYWRRDTEDPGNRYSLDLTQLKIKQPL